MLRTIDDVKKLLIDNGLELHCYHICEDVDHYACFTPKLGSTCAILCVNKDTDQDNPLATNLKGPWEYSIFNS